MHAYVAASPSAGGLSNLAKAGRMLGLAQYICTCKMAAKMLSLIATELKGLLSLSFTSQVGVAYLLLLLQSLLLPSSSS